MPHPATSTARLLPDLLIAARRFVAHGRCEALIRKWVDRRDANTLSDNAMLAVMADSMLLSDDLVVSQPSLTGGTAFDRLARSKKCDTADEKAAMTALHQSRFRLMRVESLRGETQFAVRDILSGEALEIIETLALGMTVGMTLFARTSVLPGGAACLPGAITPLDEAAATLAERHPSARASGTGNIRWAEAVYAHVVRHGTLDVPGLNRPEDFFTATDDMASNDIAESIDSPVFVAALAWSMLGEALPPPELVQKTRQLAMPALIADALHASVLARADKQTELAVGYERVLLVQLETVLRRERSGSGTLTMEALSQDVARMVAAGQMPASAQDLLGSLRLRLGAAPRAPDAPDLDRLIQRIQALRAKTVAQGCTEQEALAAAEKVAELLDRYGLSLSELDYQAQPCEGIGIQTTRRRMAPIDDCVPAIAAYFECRVWLEHAKGTALRYVFFGLRADVAAAQFLYEMVERAFETETAAFRAGELYADMQGDRRSATNSFQIGLARGIAAKLHAMRTTRDTTRRSASGRDLVPVKEAMVDAEMEKLGLAMEQRQVGKRRSVLTDAYNAGQAAGERFEITPALTRAA